MRAFPAAGDTFGDYVVDRELGRGAMGIVYLAHQSRLDRAVALKLLSPSLDQPEFRRRFQREALTLAKLNSAYIVAIHDYGEHDGWLYFTNPYMPAGDMQSRIEVRPFEPDEALRLLGQLATGLAAAHQLGIIHRDLKPANVLLAEEADGLRALLADFGIARTQGIDSTLTGGAVIGTLPYMPPERHLGGVATPAGDVYALGCVLWAMLHQRPPFVDLGGVLLLRDLLDGPPPVYSGPRARQINAVLGRCLATRVEDRFDDAVQLQQALPRPAGRYRTEPREGSRAGPGDKADEVPEETGGHFPAGEQDEAQAAETEPAGGTPRERDEQKPEGTQEPDVEPEDEPVEEEVPDHSAETLQPHIDEGLDTPEKDQHATPADVTVLSLHQKPVIPSLPDSSSTSNRRRWLEIAAVVLLVGGLLAAIVLLGQDDDGGDPEGTTDTDKLTLAPEPLSCHRLTKQELDDKADPSPAVPCSKPHTTQTIDVVPVDNLDLVDGGACIESVIEWLGGSPEDFFASILDVAYFVPDLQEQAEGASWVRCDVTTQSDLSGDAVLPPEVQSGVLASGPPDPSLAECKVGPDASVACNEPHDFEVSDVLRISGDYPATIRPLRRKRTTSRTSTALRTSGGTTSRTRTSGRQGSPT